MINLSHRLMEQTQPLSIMGVPPTNGVPLAWYVPSACGDTGRVLELQTTRARARQGSINPSRYIKEELKPIANLRRYDYPNRALSKILKLALVGYKFSTGVQSASSGFFVRNISMRSHIVMAKLWRDTLECAGHLLSLSTNPLQLCHQNYLVVIGKAPTSTGVHNCA